ncbi:MAG: hypothetical protein HY020_05995 [Burkholderiales bacterium]|nr:hypothetical protein [Burkholderiales bacterium]
MTQPDPTPLHEQPDTQGFGRVSVGLQGRVMHYIAQGPFDAALMAAANRGTHIAAARIPADGRYVSLMDFRRPLLIDEGGMREFNETVASFVTRRTLPLATILLIAPGDEDTPMVRHMVSVYRQSRPTRVCTDAAAAWAEVDRTLGEAGLPAHAVPTGLPHG